MYITYIYIYITYIYVLCVCVRVTIVHNNIIFSNNGHGCCNMTWYYSHNMLLCNTCTCVNMNRYWTEHGHWLPSIKKWHPIIHGQPLDPRQTWCKCLVVSTSPQHSQDHPPEVGKCWKPQQHQCHFCRLEQCFKPASLKAPPLAMPSNGQWHRELQVPARLDWPLYWIVLTSLATADFNRKINRLGRLGTNKKENCCPWRLGANHDHDQRVLHSTVYISNIFQDLREWLKLHIPAPSFSIAEDEGRTKQNMQTAVFASPKVLPQLQP